MTTLRDVLRSVRVFCFLSINISVLFLFFISCSEWCICVGVFVCARLLAITCGCAVCPLLYIFFFLWQATFSVPSPVIYRTPDPVICRTHTPSMRLAVVSWGAVVWQFFFFFLNVFVSIVSTLLFFIYYCPFL